jgi:hypothetical protein
MSATVVVNKNVAVTGAPAGVVGTRDVRVR